MLNVNQTSQVLQFLEEAKRLVCMTHANPDGDALGSMLGLALALTERLPGKPVLRVCRDPAPPPFRFLGKVSAIVHAYAPEKGDCLMILDCAEPKLTDFEKELPAVFSPESAALLGVRTMKIDHHPRVTDFGTLNLVDAAAASSCEIVLDIVEALALPLSPEVATCLLTGVYTDTGSMMHSNTSTRVYRTAARLLRAGADQRAIIRNVFRSSKVSTLKLWGRVLEKISLTPEGGAVSAVTAGDFRATGAEFSELTGAVDYVNSIPGMKFSLILSERGGKVKGSLRTLQEDIDVAAMAQKFSGGGHRKAAGFSIDGSLQPEVRWKVVPPVAAIPSSAPPSDGAAT